MEQMLLPILMFAALGAMMYFGMRKQKRAVAATQQMQEQLLPGTRVMTTSGLYAEVTAVADDTIELEIAPGFRTTWVRAAVREVVVPTADLSESSLDLGSLDGDAFHDRSLGGTARDGTAYDTGISEDVSLDKRQSGKDFG